MDAKTKKTLGFVSKLKPWILGADGRTPVRTDFEGYVEWSERVGGLSVRVGLDEVGDVEVSTIFLAQMHMPSDPDREHRYFETLVSHADGRAGVERRYPTWEDAERGHAEIVAGLCPKPVTDQGPKL